MESVEVALGHLIREVGDVIHGAEDVVNVTLPLRYVASLLRGTTLQGSRDTKHANLYSLKALDEISTTCREQALKASPQTPSEVVLSHAFYGGPCFAALAQLLLHKVAGDWLACFSLLEQATLFDDFFIHAPVSDAITMLVPALSYEQVSEDDEAYPAVDNLNAACAQSQRLLALILISKQGVKKLVLSLSSPEELFLEAGSNPKGMLASYQQQNSQLAQFLSSMPDRASLQAPSALQAPMYFQTVVSQLLAAAEENWRSLSSNGSCSEVLSSDKTLKFIGEVIGRLCRRGQADIIASQIVPLLLQHVLTTTSSSGVEIVEERHCLEQVIEKLHISVWPSLAASLTDSHAMERFSESLIKTIASRAGVTDWEAFCTLHTVYGKLLKERATTRSMFTEKFLFGKVLPIRCLKWILDFAILCSPPASDCHHVQPGKNHESTIQKDVMRQLADAWATKDFIQSASVQCQAYITAALGICLGSINKDALEGINGFLPSLLQGISNRLDSPLNPVRNMAKRIALAFSTVVDPEHPLLLDEEDTIENLLRWEGLEGVVGQNLKNSDAEVEKNQIPVKVEESELDEDRREVLMHGNDKDQIHGRREQRKAKKEKLAFEEDDPDAIVRLGEENSDEESEQSSDSDSESDSTLLPYNMSDDEADTSRGKFATQLTDLATNLRKGDNPDAVEEALQVAEKLVLAMPEELDNLAADLTHALVHVKCSGVAIEGEEDIAEERRQRALIALLSCSPLHTVPVLTLELFSQNVDASQRMLILDVMTAGARQLASGIDGNKSLDQDRRNSLLPNISGTSNHDSWRVPGGAYTAAGPWVEVSSTGPVGTLIGWGYSYERELPLRQGQIPLGRSRRWGQRTMQVRENNKIRSPNNPQKNRFLALAASFMLPVMHGYDKKRQWLELLDRDFLILGGILSMLGVCIECLTMHQEAAILGTGLLEMLKSREISSHPEVFVRRNALFAASRVLIALHPSDVVASLTTGVSSIVSNLEWVREWALEIAINDTDAECSMMATACVQLHSEMALQVQRSIDSFQPSGPTLEAKIRSSPSIIMPF